MIVRMLKCDNPGCTGAEVVKPIMHGWLRLSNDPLAPGLLIQPWEDSPNTPEYVKAVCGIGCMQKVIGVEVATWASQEKI